MLRAVHILAVYRNLRENAQETDGKLPGQMHIIEVHSYLLGSSP